jgi:hypothetical protein
MIELFARVPDALRPIDKGTLTPIPIGDEVPSLSAILLDDSYYTFIMEGRRQDDDLVWVGEDRLIPLKAIAWLELRDRRVAGEQIDSGNVRKHVNDVLRLSQLLTAQSSIPVRGRVLEDMRRFIEAAAGDASVQPKSVGINASLESVLQRISDAYGLRS